MMRKVKVNKIYRHFKGSLYLVEDMATHSEDGEKYVVYRALYGDCQLYIRPYSMFNSLVDRQKYPNHQQTYRFEEFKPVSINKK